MAAQGKVIITSVNNAGAGIKSAIKDLTSLENNTVRIAKKIQQAFSVVAVMAAAKQIVDFGADTVKVFGELERNMVKLKTALGGNESAFKRMDDFITVTEKKSLDLGGSVESLVAELAALGRSETDIKKITEASVALANVTGDSLDSAFTKINATYTGTAGKLEKLVPELGNLTEEQLRAGGAVDILNEKFGKISDAMAGGITQQTKNLGDTWGEFKEQIGKGLADEFSAILKGMNAFLKSMTEGLDRHQKYLKATAINATATDKLAYERAQLASQQAKQADYIKMGNQLVILKNAKDIEATEARIARLLHEQNREMRTGVTSVGADSTGYEGITIPSPALGGTGSPSAPAKTTAIDGFIPLTDFDNLNAGLTEYGNLLEDVGNQMNKTSVAADNFKFSWGDALDSISSKFQDWGTFAENLVNTIANSLSGSLESIGAALYEGSLGWEDFGAAGLKALGEVLRALGAQLAAMAVLMAIQFRWVAAAAALAGSVAAYIAAGFVDAAANDMVNEASPSSPSSTPDTTPSVRGASYAGSQPVTFNFYNQGNVVGSGGLEELALLIDSILKRNARYA